MLHTQTVNKDLIEITQILCSLPALQTFRLVGGTAAALHLGHRTSVDIDFFSNKKIKKTAVLNELRQHFPSIQAFIGTESIRANLRGVRVEIFDDWHTPFKTEPILFDRMRIATLNDIAAFKLEAITERREKKDYIDLYFIFNKLGHKLVLADFKNYNPHISMKSILFALGEVGEAESNNSVMPDMLIDVDWVDIKNSMITAARDFLANHLDL